MRELPGVTYFKPRGVPLRLLEEVVLTVEELEALRLKDIVGLHGVEAAQNMNVSRATFQRVLSSARRKVADVLVTGKALRVEGGAYELLATVARCPACKRDWANHEDDLADSERVCPSCHRTAVGDQV